MKWRFVCVIVVREVELRWYGISVDTLSLIAKQQGSTFEEQSGEKRSRQIGQVD